MMTSEGEALAVGLEEAPGRAIRLANRRRQGRAQTLAISDLKRQVSSPSTSRLAIPSVATDDAPYEDWEGYYERACAAIDHCRYRLAISLFIRVVNGNENNANAWFRLGFAYGELRRRESAIKCFDRVIQLNPEWSEAWSNRGWNRFRLRDYQGAILDFLKAVEVNPGSAPGWSNLGRAYVHLRQSASVVDAFEKACELDPNNELYAYELAKALSKSGDRERARQQFKRACELNPVFVRAWLQLAIRARHASDWPHDIQKEPRISPVITASSAPLPNLGRILRLENPILDRKAARAQERMLRAWRMVQNPVAWILIFVLAAVLYILLGK